MDNLVFIINDFSLQIKKENQNTIPSLLKQYLFFDDVFTGVTGRTCHSHASSQQQQITTIQSIPYGQNQVRPDIFFFLFKKP